MMNMVSPNQHGMAGSVVNKILHSDNNYVLHLILSLSLSYTIKPDVDICKGERIRGERGRGIERSSPLPCTNTVPLPRCHITLNIA